jgi:hypothetical protein
MAKKRKPKAKPKRKPFNRTDDARKGRGKPPTDPNEFAKWLVDRTTSG